MKKNLTDKDYSENFEGSFNKVYLTGAAGFIGSKFLEYLTVNKLFDEIVCPVRAPVKKKDFDEGIIFHEADLTNKSSVKNSIKGCDVVFHFAAKADLKNNKKLYDINMSSTRNVVEGAIESGSVKKIVYLSSVWAVDRKYPESCGKLIDEKTDCAPSTLYGKSKYDGEKIVKDSGIPYVILRLPPVYGPGSKSNYFVSRFILGIKGSNPIYRVSFPGKISLIFIGDLVKACYITAASPDINNAVFFVSDGKPVYIYEIIKAIIKGLGLNLEPIKLPEIINNILKKTAQNKFFWDIISPGFKSLFTDYLVCDSAALGKASGFKPSVPLKDGILQTIQWHKDNGWQ